MLDAAKEKVKCNMYLLLLEKAEFPAGNEYEFSFNARRYSPAT